MMRHQIMIVKYGTISNMRSFCNNMQNMQSLRNNFKHAIPQLTTIIMMLRQHWDLVESLATTIRFCHMKLDSCKGCKAHSAKTQKSFRNIVTAKVQIKTNEAA